MSVIITGVHQSLLTVKTMAWSIYSNTPKPFKWIRPCFQWKTTKQRRRTPLSTKGLIEIDSNLGKWKGSSRVKPSGVGLVWGSNTWWYHVMLWPTWWQWSMEHSDNWAETRLVELICLWSLNDAQTIHHTSLVNSQQGPVTLSLGVLPSHQPLSLWSISDRSLKGGKE